MLQGVVADPFGQMLADRQIPRITDVFLCEPLWFRRFDSADPRNFPLCPRVPPGEDAMRAYFSNLPMKMWLLLLVPAMVVAYPIARVVVSAVVHAVVPEVVRNVLTVI
jgi:hypothetical protein